MSTPSPLIDTADWTGQRVILLDRDWSHIRTKHSDLHDKLGSDVAVLAAIARVVHNPDEVRITPTKPFVARAYLRASDHLYLRVIIRYMGSHGEIRSAHFQSAPRPSEVLIWP